MYVRKRPAPAGRTPRYLLVEYVPDGNGGRRRVTLFDLHYHASVGLHLQFLRGQAAWHRRPAPSGAGPRESDLRYARHLDAEAARLREMVARGDLARAARGRPPLLPAKPRPKKGGK
jgi:hypothetical protein